jgi:hypothetical protein
MMLFQPRPGFPANRLLRALVAAGLLALALGPASAAVRFDVFIGYEGILPDSAWFPVTVEVQNDGPSFVAQFEIEPSQAQQGQTRTMTVDLPTGTLKRFSLPLYAGSRSGWMSWDASLRDERGRLRAVQKGVRVRRQNSDRMPLLAALTRTAPVFPELKNPQSEFQPVIARLTTSLFPDSPISLDGVNVIYLSSEKALDLTVNQVHALTAWLHAGGRLVVGIEQVVHLNGAPWLQKLLPADFNALTMLPSHPQLQEWLGSAFETNRLARATPRVIPSRRVGNQRQINPPPAGPAAAYLVPSTDEKFEEAPIQIATGSRRDGEVKMGTADAPLALSARRGRGEIIALTFSPELEPFHSWKNKTWFWARLAEIPPSVFQEKETSNPYYGGWSMDAVFGAMTDSTQVRKLPIGWLLVLLSAYLVVIGPLDRYWLNRINRPMLTWITFPCYVVFFSVLIYVIGYKLRAGEREYTELHLIDVIPDGDKSYWRGRTYASIYSPANARLPMASDLPHATLRGEASARWNSSQEASRVRVEQRGHNYTAQATVPVWTSQLFVGDWWTRQEAPLAVSVTARGAGEWDVHVENRTDAAFTEVRCAFKDRIQQFGAVPARSATNFVLRPNSSSPLQTFAANYASTFQNAINQRNQAFAAGERVRLHDIAEASVAASFAGFMSSGNDNMRFTVPGGLDLLPLVLQGDAVVLAWAPDWAPVPDQARFTAPRTHHNTLLRISTEVK